MPSVREAGERVRREGRPEGLEAVEREHIVRVLAELGGNKVAAAKRLGISRRTLYRRLERHGLMGITPRTDRESDEPGWHNPLCQPRGWHSGGTPKWQSGVYITTT